MGRTLWTACLVVSAAFVSHGGPARADNPDYVESQGYSEMRAALTQLDSQGSKLSPALVAKFKAEGDSIVRAEDADRSGTAPLQAEVKRIRTKEESFKREREALEAKYGSFDGTAPLLPSQTPEIADFDKRLSAHKQAMDDLNQRVWDANLAHETRIALLTRRILNALAGHPEKDEPKIQVDPAEVTSAAEGLSNLAQFKKNKDAKGKTVTHCNEFLDALAKQAFGYDGFAGKRANAIFDLIRSKQDGWTPIQDPFLLDADANPTLMEKNLALAQKFANAGYLVVAALQNPKGRGHVAAVVPGEVAPSDAKHWNMNVPMTAQAGSENWPKSKMSRGFPANDPDDFTWWGLAKPADARDRVVIYVRKSVGPAGQGSAAGR